MQACQTIEYSFSQVADRVFSQIQALQKTQSYESCLLKSRQMIERQVPAQNKIRNTLLIPEEIARSQFLHASIK